MGKFCRNLRQGPPRPIAALWAAASGSPDGSWPCSWLLWEAGLSGTTPPALRPYGELGGGRPVCVCRARCCAGALWGCRSGLLAAATTGVAAANLLSKSAGSFLPACWPDDPRRTPLLLLGGIGSLWIAHHLQLLDAGFCCATQGPGQPPRGPAPWLSFSRGGLALAAAPPAWSTSRGCGIRLARGRLDRSAGASALSGSTALLEAPHARVRPAHKILLEIPTPVSGQALPGVSRRRGRSCSFGRDLSNTAVKLRAVWSWAQEMLDARWAGRLSRARSRLQGIAEHFRRAGRRTV